MIWIKPPEAPGPSRLVCIDGHCSPDDPMLYLDLLASSAEALGAVTLRYLPAFPEGSCPGQTGPLQPEADDPEDFDPTAESARWIVDPAKN
jgi:hypothetical protein